MQRKAAEAIIREWEVRAPRLEPMCRMLLLAERYSVTLLRDLCLHALAARFEALVEERAPRHDREVFEAFVAAVAPRVRQSAPKWSHLSWLYDTMLTLLPITVATLIQCWLLGGDTLLARS